MTIRSPEHNDTFFSSQAEDNHRYARSSLHALYFSFFHEPYVIEAFRVLVEQEETDWHSTSTTNAHIDEALPLLLPPPPPPLPHRAIARKALVSRLIFFYRADLQSSRPWLVIARRGVIDVEIIIGERSRNKSKNHVKFLLPR